MIPITGRQASMRISIKAKLKGKDGQDSTPFRLRLAAAGNSSGPYPDAIRFLYVRRIPGCVECRRDRTSTAR